jgi:hypothetical protein
MVAQRKAPQGRSDFHTMMAMCVTLRPLCSCSCAITGRRISSVRSHGTPMRFGIASHLIHLSRRRTTGILWENDLPMSRLDGGHRQVPAGSYDREAGMLLTSTCEFRR